MGLSEEEQRKAQELRLQMNEETYELNSKNLKQEAEDVVATASASCCQGTISSSCCQNGAVNGKSANHHANSVEQESRQVLPRPRNKENKPSCSTRKTSALPTWFECWEREDTYATVAVIAAVASVAAAISYYRQLR